MLLLLLTQCVCLISIISCPAHLFVVLIQLNPARTLPRTLVNIPRSLASSVLAHTNQSSPSVYSQVRKFYRKMNQLVDTANRNLAQQSIHEQQYEIVEAPSFLPVYESGPDTERVERWKREREQREAEKAERHARLNIEYNTWSQEQEEYRRRANEDRLRRAAEGDSRRVAQGESRRVAALSSTSQALDAASIAEAMPIMVQSVILGEPLDISLLVQRNHDKKLVDLW